MKRLLCFLGVMALAACGGGNQGGVSQVEYAPVATPTVDYVETLDVYSAPHRDSFLNQLAMNYRSYAIYNARTSGYPEIGELFAQKAVAAFSGETPFPETMDNWPVGDEQLGFEMHDSYRQLINALKNDASVTEPEAAAEAQAKYDCWLSAYASGQVNTAEECRQRFVNALSSLDCGDAGVVESPVAPKKTTTRTVETRRVTQETNYPETRRMAAMTDTARSREGIIIVNNVNLPESLIRPEPVVERVIETVIEPECPEVGGCNNTTPDVVTRAEFVEMMLALRSELAAINARLDKLEERPAPVVADNKTLIKVQQIPLEPKQHVMEEVFEVRFDFDKSKIKPEYEDLIRKLATATQENKNIKVTVIGHTDTSGSKAYNYALGGRRATAVAKMLSEYGIPSSQIVATSAGEMDLKVETGDGVPNAANRRVRVTKETHYTEPAGKPEPLRVEVEECEGDFCKGGIPCDECGVWVDYSK